MTKCQKAKDKLRQIQKLDNLINNKQREIQKLRMQLYSKGSNYGERISGGTPKSEADRIIKIVDFETEMNKDIDRLIDLKKETMKQIDQLENPDYIDLLYKRYFMFWNWEQIADAQCICLRQVYRRHGEALLEFQKILDED